MHDVYVIRTPENVAFELELAGLGSRALAWVIDMGVMAVLLSAAAIVVALLGTGMPDLATALMFIVAFAVQWGYAVVLETLWSGRTVGKRLAGIRVVDERGGPIRFQQAVVRNLVRVVDLLPLAYLLGAASVVLRDDGRRLGDVAAGTVVVRVRRSPAPLAVVAKAERYNSFVKDPNVVIAARRVSAPEREVLLALALRREGLPLAVRHRLFGRMANHLEQRLGVARPDFFSDEKLVLNLTAVVLGTSVGYRLAPRAKGAE